eukprot:Nitzschia sp. Nitz4//scaffold92_size79448//67430//68589//NITZ4_005402-RA/size79448-augustus-gene-0.35-mRNA-1//-1//CDS//3329560219//7321//frame0
MADEALWWHGDAQNTSHEPESDDGGANAPEVEGRPETKFDLALAGVGLLILVYILYRRYRKKRRRQNSSAIQETDHVAGGGEPDSPQILTEREKRKEWYLHYLLPYTMSVTDTDFVMQDKDVEKAESTISGSTTSQFSSSEDLSRDAMEAADETSSSSHDDESNNMDLEAQFYPSPPTELEPIGVRLPKDANAPAGTARRVVDTECAICVSTYEKADLLVWSGLGDCPHAFHHECILEWLCKGKKRCPICRHWFVPGAPIEKQRKQWELQQAASVAATPCTPTGDLATTVTNPEHQEENLHPDGADDSNNEGSDPCAGSPEESVSQTSSSCSPSGAQAEDTTLPRSNGSSSGKSEEATT